MAYPGPKNWPDKSVGFPPAMNMVEHLEHAIQQLHPLLQPPVLESGFQHTAQVQEHAGQFLSYLRAHLAAEVEEVVSEWETTAGCALHPNILKVYTDQTDRPDMRLLKECGYPETERLMVDFTEGFPMVGSIPQGAGWLPRMDERYSFPIGMETFHSLSQQYLNG